MFGVVGVVLDAIIAGKAPEARLLPVGPQWLSPIATFSIRSSSPKNSVTT